MGRAPCCSKVGLHRGPWTVREDALLVKYIETHGEGQWRSMPKKAGLLRCGKSCRLRWMNYLRPDIKRGNITPEEDDLIIRLHGLLGNRWSLIAGRLPGRTDNEIKNYWNTHLSKRLRSQGTDPDTQKKLSQADIEKRAKFFNKKRFRSSTNKSRSQKIIEHINKNNNNDGEQREKSKIHSPKPIRVTSVVSMTRHNSNGSFETTVSTTSASSSQSQSQSQNNSHGITYESDYTILDMPWLLNSVNMAEENGFDHLMTIGSCGDHINVDIMHIHERNDALATPDSNKQFEKLYEEYLQLIKADHVDDDDGNDDDDDDAQLDLFTESFLI